jgi:hypothetical protein
MASIKPINVGNSKRLESLYAGFKGKITGKNRVANRESSPGYYNNAALNYSSTVLSVDPSKRYK